MLKQIIITALKSKIGKRIVELLLTEFIQWFRNRGYIVAGGHTNKLFESAESVEDIIKLNIRFYCQNELEKFNPKI